MAGAAISCTGTGNISCSTPRSIGGASSALSSSVSSNTSAESDLGLVALGNFTRPLLDRLSMTHVRDASPILWLHFVSHFHQRIESRLAYEWGTSHMGMSHVIHMNESPQPYCNEIRQMFCCSAVSCCSVLLQCFEGIAAFVSSYR